MFPTDFNLEAEFSYQLIVSKLKIAAKARPVNSFILLQCRSSMNQNSKSLEYLIKRPCRVHFRRIDKLGCIRGKNTNIITNRAFFRNHKSMYVRILYIIVIKSHKFHKSVIFIGAYRNSSLGIKKVVFSSTSSSGTVSVSKLVKFYEITKKEFLTEELHGCFLMESIQNYFEIKLTKYLEGFGWMVPYHV